LVSAEKCKKVQKSAQEFEMKELEWESESPSLSVRKVFQNGKNTPTPPVFA
jgi:hypothetical protein